MNDQTLFNIVRSGDPLPATADLREPPREILERVLTSPRGWQIISVRAPACPDWLSRARPDRARRLGAPRRACTRAGRRCQSRQPGDRRHQRHVAVRAATACASPIPAGRSGLDDPGPSPVALLRARAPSAGRVCAAASPASADASAVQAWRQDAGHRSRRRVGSPSPSAVPTASTMPRRGSRSWSGRARRSTKWTADDPGFLGPSYLASAARAGSNRVAASETLASSKCE